MRYGSLAATVWILLIAGAHARGAAVAPPRAFEAIAASATEIRCYWLPAAGAAGYRIERDGQPVADLPAECNTFSDTGLTPNSTHRYALRAVSGGAVSPARSYTERTFARFPELAAGAKGSRGSLPVEDFDVVVVQASSGGVAAAIEAARRGYNVALIEPTTRLGGMPVCGLSATDLRRPADASGFFVRFRDRVHAIFAEEGVKASGLAYEPRVAHRAIKSLLYETSGITIYRRVRLARVLTEVSDAVAGRKRVRAVVAEEVDGAGALTGRRAEFRAGVFIDATDCGDLAAWAGAPFRIGREARSPAEPHNGVIYYDRAGDRSLPGSTGAADRRVMSYAYLLTVKDYGPGTDRRGAPPPGYRKEDFIHSPAWKDSWAFTSGAMPGGKYELNQHPQGNDLQEINYRYASGDYRERARVEKLYRDHVLCYLYYIQTEQGQKQLGLPDDEYRDSGGFPPLLYVREGRRILGEELPKENDITDARNRVRPESVGIGDYPMDSHAVRRKTDWDRPDMGEGEWWLYKYTPWHQLPLGVLIPQRLDNVFVTTAVSSTHVSFGTYRLEPVRMAFGQAAGIAATYCLRYRLRARDVPARQVQDDLLPHAANPWGDRAIQLYFLPDVRFGSRHFRAIQFLAARGFLADGTEFKPEAPTTRRELARWVRLLTARDPIAADGIGRVADTDAPRGAAWFGSNGKAVDTFAAAGDPDRPVSRLEMAQLLIAALPRVYRDTRAVRRYEDCDDSAPVELFDQGIDSRLWDGAQARASDGKLLFRPQAPIRHADLFETLYIAQLGLGPLFNDNPIDGRNGRETPPDYFAELQADLEEAPRGAP